MTRVAAKLSCGLVGGLLLAGASQAQADWPDYETCIDIAVGQFEQTLMRSRNQASEANFDIVDRDNIDFCGVLAIVTCDVSDDRFACQANLAARQTALRGQVLESLPEPDAVRGLDPNWSDGLYPQIYAVAHGSSAGPDCEGGDPAYEAWCITRQASLKVAEAISVWQVARVLGAVDTAIELGWANEPPPTPPTPRPERSP